jgi:hypothetical protein
MDGPAPAVVNAIVDAVGVPFNSVPVMPEDIFDSLQDRAARDLHSSAGGQGAQEKR